MVWTTSVRMTVKAKGWRNHQPFYEVIAGIISSLTGQALLHTRELDEEQYFNLDDFFNDFRKTALGGSCREKANYLFRRRTQTSKEDVQTYWSDLKILFQAANPDIDDVERNHTLIRRFMTGCYNKKASMWARMVPGTPPVSYTDAKQRMLLSETNLAEQTFGNDEYPEQNRKHEASKPVPMEIGAVMGLHKGSGRGSAGGKANSLRKSRETGTRAKGSNGNGGNGGKSGNSGKTGSTGSKPSKNQTKQSDRKEGKCFTCHKTGHVSRECPDKKASVNAVGTTVRIEDNRQFSDDEDWEPEDSALGGVIGQYDGADDISDTEELSDADGAVVPVDTCYRQIPTKANDVQELQERRSRWCDFEVPEAKRRRRDSGRARSQSESSPKNGISRGERGAQGPRQ